MAECAEDHTAWREVGERIRLKWDIDLAFDEDLFVWGQVFEC